MIYYSLIAVSKCLRNISYCISINSYFIYMITIRYVWSLNSCIFSWHSFLSFGCRNYLASLHYFNSILYWNMLYSYYNLIIYFLTNIVIISNFIFTIFARNYFGFIDCNFNYLIAFWYIRHLYCCLSSRLSLI